MINFFTVNFMMEILLLLYLGFIIAVLGALVMITYHLLSFRLNPSLARFMITLMWSGAIILLLLNVYYFYRIDWEVLLAEFLL